MGPTLNATMAKKFTRKKFARKKGRSNKQGKFSTLHRRRLGRPSRGLTKSNYMYAVRTTQTIPDLSNIPGNLAPRWSNNQGTIVSAFHRGVFTLADLPAPRVTDFHNMYSAYRINAVKVEFVFSGNLAIQVPPGTSPLQLNAYSFYDPTGNWFNTIPTEEQCLLMQSCKRKQTNTQSRTTVYAKMKQANAILGTTAINAYNQQKPKWISTEYLSVNHYGINTLFTSSGARPTGAAPACPVQMITTYYLEFKGVKP